MTRYERKLYFERLVALRDAYRAETRESTGMTIEQAMTFAEQAFNDAVAADAASIETALAKGGRRPNDALLPFPQKPRNLLSGASAAMPAWRCGARQPPVAASPTRAAARATSSRHGCATSCTPIGRPSGKVATDDTSRAVMARASHAAD